MSKMNLTFITIISLISVISSGCSYRDIDSGVISEGYALMAGLNLSQVEFTSGHIKEHTWNDITECSFEYSLSVKNKVTVDSVLGQYPKTLNRGSAWIISINGKNDYDLMTSDRFDLQGQYKINPYHEHNFRVNNKFSLPSDYLGDSGKIEITNYFTEQTEGDPKIKQMNQGVLTTINYTRDSRTKKYEIECNSVIITVKKSRLDIHI